VLVLLAALALLLIRTVVHRRTTEGFITLSKLAQFRKKSQGKLQKLKKKHDNSNNGTSRQRRNTADFQDIIGNDSPDIIDSSHIKNSMVDYYNSFNNKLLNSKKMDMKHLGKKWNFFKSRFWDIFSS
jgi:hypothetical protein